MNGVIIGLWVTGTMAVTLLDLAGYPLQVTGGIAAGVILAGIALDFLLECRERRAREAVPGGAPEWTARELAALDNDILLRDLLKATPVTRREGKYR